VRCRLDLSDQEQNLQCCATEQFSLWLGKDLAVIRYQLDLSLVGNRSSTVPLPTNLHSVSGWEATLERCTTQQFSLQPETDLVVSLYPLILFPAANLL